MDSGLIDYKMTGSDLAQSLIAFCRQIGLVISERNLDIGRSMLPGVQIQSGSIEVDRFGLIHPGDILYAASCLAICHPSKRANTSTPLSFKDKQSQTAHSMAASAWCYAACLHLKIPPRIVFHDGGYQGQGKWLATSYQGGQYFVLPLLKLFGMTHDKTSAESFGALPFPSMTKWIRTDDSFPNISFYC